MFNKKLIKFLIKLTISIGFLAWIILKTNWQEVWFHLREVEIWKLFLYVIVILLGIVISAYKWQVIAAFKNIHFPLRYFFKFYLIGAFLNNFMPSFIGGDTFKAYQIGKHDKRYVEAASTVMMDRITGFVGASILVFLFSLLNIKTVFQNKILLVMNALIIASFVFDVFIAKIKSLPFFERIRAYLPEKIVHLIDELGHYNKSSTMNKAVVISVVFGMVGVALANYILFWAVGIKIGALNYLSVIFLISIISALPISINNIGLKEWAYITFFGLFGVSASLVVTAALLSRFIQMVISFFALPAYLRSKN